MYSHWMMMDSNVVLLWGPSYHQRLVKYVMTKSSTYIVPYRDQAIGPSHIKYSVGGYEQLLIGETKLSNILERFEDRSFIHITALVAEKAVKYSMPRFSLVLCISVVLLNLLSFLDMFLLLNSPFATPFRVSIEPSF